VRAQLREEPPVRDFLRRHGAMIVNLLVFFGIGHWVAAYFLDAWREHRLDFVEVAFGIHNVIFLALILVRTPHRAIDTNVARQAVALCAFFSGLAFVDRVTESAALLAASKAVILLAIVLGTATLLNLGRSFGILIAIRSVKTRGLYGLVRHPMYATDILWKIGMLLKKPCALNAAIFAASVACYVWRALLEERFLAAQPEYREYMARVKYRFIPGVF
jgi:protein-S-isoprenylcysteine O-methyltransferase Ste14